MNREHNLNKLKVNFFIRFHDERSICESHILNIFSDFLHDEDVNGEFELDTMEMYDEDDADNTSMMNCAFIH